MRAKKKTSPRGKCQLPLVRPSKAPEKIYLGIKRRAIVDLPLHMFMTWEVPYGAACVTWINTRYNVVSVKDILVTVVLPLWQ